MPAPTVLAGLAAPARLQCKTAGTGPGGHLWPAAAWCLETAFLLSLWPAPVASILATPRGPGSRLWPAPVALAAPDREQSGSAELEPSAPPTAGAPTPASPEFVAIPCLFATTASPCQL